LTESSLWPLKPLILLGVTLLFPCKNTEIVSISVHETWLRGVSSTSACVLGLAETWDFLASSEDGVLIHAWCHFKGSRTWSVLLVLVRSGIVASGP
jgi:hypothetical protein